MNAVNQSASGGKRAAALSQERVGGRVGGWLLLFCLLLLVWQPVSLALVASSVLGAVTIRGLPTALVLLTRLLAASLGIAAGLALLGRRPGAVTLAKVSLAVSAATDVFVYTTPFFPNNRLPGDTALLVGVSLAYHGVWMIYLFRSKRVKEIF